MAKSAWLMKSEPDVYSLQDLQQDGSSLWEGVRNYQARNFMTQSMEVGDHVLFYHSNAEPPGIAGLARVKTKAVPDPTQYNKRSEYFDAKATKEKPIWFCVEVEFVQEFSHFIGLEELRKHGGLQDLLVLKKGQRLSVQPVSMAHYSLLLKLGQGK